MWETLIFEMSFKLLLLYVGDERIQSQAFVSSAKTALGSHGLLGVG